LRGVLSFLAGRHAFLFNRDSELSVKLGSKDSRSGQAANLLFPKSIQHHFVLHFLLAVPLFIAAAIPVSMPAANRQQQSASPATQQPLQVTTEIVKLDTTVTDERGEFVTGLQLKNFRVLDRDTEQPIIFFAPTDAPAQILVMVETSPAVYLIQADHIAAINALASGLAPDDEIALVVYNEAPRTILPFTQDRASLTTALGQIQYTLGFGELNLFDSLSAVLDSIAPAAGKKTIVLLTTGLDSSSASHWQALLPKLRSSDVVIFPVALGASLRTPAKKKKGKAAPESDEPHVFADADKALRSLAEITGGRAFFPESASDFAPMYQEIAATLRHQYVLGIAPAHDGQFHALKIQLLDENGLPYSTAGKNTSRRIFVRQGYLAPTP
jgi:Ca-activated chloride channel family protein